MSLELITFTGYTDLFALFDSATLLGIGVDDFIALPATEGSGIHQCHYSISADDAIAASLPAGAYNVRFLHGDYSTPTGAEPEEGVALGVYWDGTSFYIEGEMLASLMVNSGGASAISPKYVFDNRRWRFDSRDQNSAVNVLYDVSPLTAEYFAMDFNNVIDPRTTIRTAVISTSTPTGLTFGTLLLETNLREVHIPITCTITGSFTVVVKATTYDSHEYIRRGTLSLGNLVGT